MTQPMTPENSVTIAPWVLAGVVVLGVLSLSIAIRAILPPPVTLVIGTALLAGAVLVAIITAVLLIARGQLFSRAFAFTVFLVALFLGVLLG